jgi:hypothetical protein
VQVQRAWLDVAHIRANPAARAAADDDDLRQVGLTNMDVAAVSKIVDAGVPVANNQVGPGVVEVAAAQCGTVYQLAESSRRNIAWTPAA